MCVKIAGSQREAAASSWQIPLCSAECNKRTNASRGRRASSSSSSAPTSESPNVRGQSSRPESSVGSVQRVWTSSGARGGRQQAPDTPKMIQCPKSHQVYKTRARGRPRGGPRANNYKGSVTWTSLTLTLTGNIEERGVRTLDVAGDVTGANAGLECGADRPNPSECGADRGCPSVLAAATSERMTGSGRQSLVDARHIGHFIDSAGLALRRSLRQSWQSGWPHCGATGWTSVSKQIGQASSTFSMPPMPSETLLCRERAISSVRRRAGAMSSATMRSGGAGRH